MSTKLTFVSLSLSCNSKGTSMHFQTLSQKQNGSLSPSHCRCSYNVIIIIIIIIIITTTIFIVLSFTAHAICENSLWFAWAKVGQRQVAANPQAKLQTWPLSPSSGGALNSTHSPVGCYRSKYSPIAMYYYSTIRLILVYRTSTIIR